MNTLEQMRAKILAKKNQNNTEKKTGGGDKAFFPFWDTPEGKSATLRFLPDADTKNDYFWVERSVIKLPFQGIIGEHDNELTVQVPCMDMYGEKDPILAEIRPWWQDPEMKPTASKYWKKRSFIYQGFVVDKAFDETDLPENPIRRFSINSSIHEIIEASLMDEDMEYLPTDYNNGSDFRIIKTRKGDYANYTTSKWTRSSRSLNDAEREAIETYGLFNLKDFLPAKPTDEAKNAIMEMFEASVNGEAYDPQRWGTFFKPFGMQTKVDAPATSLPKATTKTFTPKSEVSETESVEETDSSSNSSNDPMEIIRRLKAKKNG